MLRHLVRPLLKNNSNSSVEIWHVLQEICQPPAHLHAQDLPFFGAAPYLSHLQHPFSTGSVISVTGTLHRDTEWWVQIEHPVESQHMHQSSTVFDVVVCWNIASSTDEWVTIFWKNLLPFSAGMKGIEGESSSEIRQHGATSQKTVVLLINTTRSCSLVYLCLQTLVLRCCQDVMIG